MLARTVNGKGLRQGSGKLPCPEKSFPYVSFIRLYSADIRSRASRDLLSNNAFAVDLTIDDRPFIVFVLSFGAERMPAADSTPTRTLFPSLSRAVPGPNNTPKHYFAGIELTDS